MGILKEKVTGRVTKVETVKFKSYRQINIGIPKETTLVTVTGDDGAEHRGYLLGHHDDITTHMRLELDVRKAWNAQQVVKNNTAGTVELMPPSITLDPFHMVYRKIDRYKSIR